MKITPQQQEIVDSVLHYKNIKINAFAGTGKTTTLKLIAQSNPQKKILYLAFNSANKLEASKIFPSNTVVKTTHGLAFGAISQNTSLNLKSLTNYRAIDIAKKFEVTYNQAIAALKIFESFCNSNREKIELSDKEHQTAQKIFDHMLHSKIDPSHSFYLKYYSLLLSKKQIKALAYDIIMLDEAQDTNGVTLSIFANLNAKVKIYVGDKHQQIYSFRGSKNALNKIKSDKKLYLSTSFRFNANIAHFANTLLKNFKNETIQINTHEQKNSSTIKTNASISRTNAYLISIIYQRIQERKPFVTIRNPNEIFTLTIEVHYLLTQQKEKIKRNRFLKEFDNDHDILEYASNADDYELKSALKIAKEYKEKIFECKEIAEKFYTAWNNRQRNGFEKRINEILFLTTAHTSKGLEWDRVTIVDDFTDFADLIVDFGSPTLEAFQKEQNNLPNQELIDEFNLFYVAITRAKKVLIKESDNFHYLMAENIEKLINTRIKQAHKDLQYTNAGKREKLSKLQTEEKQKLREQTNQKEGRVKNSGLKWRLEEKIKAKSMFHKNAPLPQIASKLERTTGAILGELRKSEIITQKEQSILATLLKKTPIMAKKSELP